jgi:hypothetical protein
MGTSTGIALPRTSIGNFARLGTNISCAPVVTRTDGYGLGFPDIRCWGRDFTTVLEVAHVRSTDRNCMILLSLYFIICVPNKKESSAETLHPPPDFTY